MCQRKPASLDAHKRSLRLVRAHGRADRLAALQTAARELAQAHDQDEVFAILGRHAQIVTQSRVWAGIYDAGTDMLDVRFWLEDGERLPAWEGPQTGATGLGGVVARTGTTIATADYAAECQRIGSIPDGPVADEMRHQMPWVGVPLVSRGHVLGVLSASQNRGEPFDATLVELLETLAAHSSMALENLALRAEDAVRRAETHAHAAQLADSELRYRLLFEQNPHPMWVFDLETLNFLAVNDAAVRHYGYSRDEFLTMQVSAIRLPEDIPDFLTRVRGVVGTAGVWTHRTKDGAQITVDIVSHPIMFADRSARFSVMTDITDHQQAVADLRQQALHDSLTGLPNRVLLLDRLKSSLSLVDRDTDQPLALLVLDLDRFKEVNDTFGHKCGDVLLQLVSARFEAVLPCRSTLARLGGDEFAVLLPNANAEMAIKVSEQLIRTLEEPFVVEGVGLAIGASIGIAVFPEHASDTDTLLRRADVAMYVAKRNNQGCAVYDRAQDRHSPDRLALVGEIWEAIERNELLLHYQPKLDMRSGTLIGVEALVRWQHPQRGFLPPSDFIPLAEQTGLIDPLSRWVLEAALMQQHAWRGEGLDIPVAVNLSRRTLHDPQLPDTIAKLLTRWNVPPSALVLEITESSLMADPVRAGENLKQLRALGVHMSIDDFGTGYSSLASLKDLLVDELKIDQSFVQAMATDASARAIVRAIIDLADALKLRIVAEGIEDQATWDVLAGLGCEVAQGYFLSRPLTANDLKAWLAEVSSAWLSIAGSSHVEGTLQDRIRRRGARLIAEDEFIARKHSEAALRAVEQRNRLALQAAGMGTWDWDVINDVHTWSAETEVLSGLTPGTYDGTFAAFRRAIHPDDWPAFEIEERAAQAERRDSLTTYRAVWPDGSAHWLESKGRALYADDGALLRVSGTAMDIAQRKQAEEALRTSEERFQRQYKGIPLPTYSWLSIDHDFVLQNYNDAAEVLTEGRIRDWLGVRASAHYVDQPEMLVSLRACLTERRTLRQETLLRLRTAGPERQAVVTYVFVPPLTVTVHIEDTIQTKHSEHRHQTGSIRAVLPLDRLGSITQKHRAG